MTPITFSVMAITMWFWRRKVTFSHKQLGIIIFVPAFINIFFPLHLFTNERNTLPLRDYLLSISHNLTISIAISFITVLIIRMIKNERDK